MYFYNNRKDVLVSIIVPVYNVQSYLEDCIICLRNQTYKNIEIVLIDDGSTDHSGQLCDMFSRLDNRITVIHKKNGGLSDARNVGIIKSKGALFCCVDSDDLVADDYVEILIDGMMKYDCDISIGKIVTFTDSMNPFNNLTHNHNYIKNWKIYSQNEALLQMLLQNDFDVSACGKLYKKELFKGINYPVGKIYEDLATTYKMVAKCKKVCFVNTPIYAYRRNREGSITSAKFSIKKMELLKSFQPFYEYILSQKPNLKSAAECRYAMSAAGILEGIYLSADSKKYKDIIFKMRKVIIHRYKYVFFEKKLLLQRKLKIFLASFSRKLYLLALKCHNKANIKKDGHNGKNKT